MIRFYSMLIFFGFIIFYLDILFEKKKYLRYFIVKFFKVKVNDLIICENVKKKKIYVLIKWNKKIKWSVNCVIINLRNENIFILIYIIFKFDMK